MPSVPVLKTPVFTATAVITLALCIGALTTIFSFVNGLLLRPLPFHEPDRLMMVEEKWLPRFPRFEASPLDFLAWREQSTAFSQLAAFKPHAFNLTGDDRPERLVGARVSANLMSLLGVDPVIGRSFSADEDKDGNNRVVLLGHQLWQRRFGGDSRVVGSAVILNGLSFTIAGVMPQGFDFPRDTEIWMPMGFTAQELESRSNHIVWAVGRLKTGVTREQAQAEMDLIMPRLQKVWGANVVPLEDHYVGDIRLALLVLLGAGGFVLLIACVNVANLLLSRASVRQMEFSLRAALGASRTRIIQQLLTETLLLASLGGALGIAVAWLGVTLLKSVPAFISAPRVDQVNIDTPVLLFTSVASILTGLIFGLSPVVSLSRLDLQDSLKRSGKTGGLETRGRTRLRNGLVVFEVAAALVLLAGAGLLLKSFWRIIEVHPGLNPQSVLTARIDLPATSYPEGFQQSRFAEQFLQQLRSQPEVRDAAISTGLPFSTVGDSGIHFEGRVGELAGTAANHYRITPQYQQAMHIPLIRGRLFNDGDAAERRPVVLINETMASRFFPDEDPLGKRLDISGPTYMREIVGVVGDVKQDGLRRPTPPQVYEPFYQKPSTGFIIFVRGTGDPMRLAEVLRRAVGTVDRNQPISQIRAMDEIVAVSLSADRMSAALLSLFGLLALGLAAVGVFGVLAYSVSQRTREIGVRMALGAHWSGILQLVIRQGLQIVLVGIAIGVAASLALSRVLGTLLYQVEPTDPATLMSVSLVLLGVAVIAAIIPAQRAARVDPLAALRCE